MGIMNTAPSREHRNGQTFITAMIAGERVTRLEAPGVMTDMEAAVKQARKARAAK